MLKSLKNCETEQIYHVTDPWDLSFIPENRDTDQKLVSQIMNAMRQNEYIFPIYITESGAVIDGQHRLKAFRNLAEEEPGKYFLRTIVINSNKSPIELAIIFNAFRKNWTTKDYLRSYVRQKLPSYIVLNGFLKKYPLLDIKAGIQLIKEVLYQSLLKKKKWLLIKQNFSIKYMILSKTNVFLDEIVYLVSIEYTLKSIRLQNF